MPSETEIKLRASDLPAIRRRLRAIGFRVHKRRIFESNVLLDTSDRTLAGKDEMIRIRRAGPKAKLTYKGKSQSGAHKSREEIETDILEPGTLEKIFGCLGLNPSFRYEKYRTEYKHAGQHGVVTVDETPIGNYIEIEGAPDWIDRTARRLGFTTGDYIKENYGEIYLEYCRDHGIKPSNMVFKQRRNRR